jgi:glycosyltransferase involved in cell wall biosynthesis
MGIRDVKICMDARKIDDFGIGTYVRNLLEWYPRVENRFRFFLICEPGDAARFRRMENYTPCISDCGKYSLREQWDIPRILRRVRPGLYHSPHYVTPVAGPFPMVATIHDLIHLIFPQYLPSRAAHVYARLMFLNTVKHAERIITDSEWSKNDLMRLAGAPEKKIRVVRLAADGRFGRRPPGTAPAAKAGRIDGPYVLFVGNFKPHKNVEGLIEAFRKIPESLCRYLVLAGRGWDRAPDLRRRILALNLEKRVLVREELPFESLNALYLGAELLVLPSFYEGFGLTPLEAMACGVPVAASRAASIPEICGNAAVYFDPGRPGEIADAVLQLLKDSRLRKTCIRNGRKRLERYSWEKTAIETLDVYREVV